MSILFQNILQAIRSLRTQAWQVATSSVGLAVGIVCLTFSSNWFWTETNYDWFRPDYRNLYIAQYTLEDGKPTGGGVHNEDREAIYNALNGTGTEYGNVEGVRWLELKSDGEAHEVATVSMDSAAFKLLGVEVLDGSIQDLFTDGLYHVAITDSMALRVFGTTDAVGRTLQSENWFGYPNTGVRVKAVVRSNEGVSIYPFDCIRVLTSIDEEWTNLLLHVQDAGEVKDKLKTLKAQYLESHYKGMTITPLRMLHTIGWGEDFIDAYFYQIAFTIIALLLVASAVTNLIMVFTSIYLARVREYALRRSMGATAWQNVQWILVGLLPTLVITVLLAGMGVEWTLELADIPWDVSTINIFYALTIVTTFALCIIGMAYPIHKLRRAYRSSFLGHGDGGRSHLWLIVVQCMASAFLLFLSMGMQGQVYGMMTADMGYERDNILRLHTGVSPIEGQEEAYDFSPIFGDVIQEIRNSAGPEITDVIGMRSDIFSASFMGIKSVMDEENYRKDSWGLFTRVSFAHIPYHAFDFFNIRLKNGVKLEKYPEESDKLHVVLDSAAMNALAPDGTFHHKYFISPRGNEVNLAAEYKGAPQGIRKHIFALNGKELVPVGETIIRLRDFRKPAGAIAIIPVEENFKIDNAMCDAIYIKYAEDKRNEAEATVRNVLNKFDVPEEKIQIQSFGQYIADRYTQERYYANLLTVLTTLSIVITLAGVFSMLLYSLRLRRRSMAIHRVMGATFKDIFIPTLRPYLIYAAIGAVVAYFPAEILMHKWMEYFHYGNAPGVWLMLTILVAMLGIIFLIVWWQVSLCMKDKPVEILKPEA